MHSLEIIKRRNAEAALKFRCASAVALLRLVVENFTEMIHDRASNDLMVDIENFLERTTHARTNEGGTSRTTA